MLIKTMQQYGSGISVLFLQFDVLVLSDLALVYDGHCVSCVGFRVAMSLISFDF